MIMYGIRYFEKEQEKKIILLYPNYEWENYDINYISEEDIKIFIKTINLNFDLSDKKWKDSLINEFNFL